MTEQPPEAVITGPSGWVFRYHAMYTDGMFIVERGDFGFTRKAIDRKVRRMLKRLAHDRERQANATRLT